MYEKLKATVLFLVLVTLLFSPVMAEVNYFGFTGAITDFKRVGSEVTFKSWLNEQKVTFGIDVSVGLVFCPADYTLLADAMPDVLNTFQDANTMLILDLSFLIFQRHTSGTFDCSGYGGSTNTPANGDHPKDRFYPNWQARLNDFKQRVNNLITPGNTVMISIHAEVNNCCVPSYQIENAAIKVREKFPGIPLAAAYALRTDKMETQGLPYRFPYKLDKIAFWAYGIYNPFMPGNLKNNTVDGDFYDPANPNNPNTKWGDLRKRLCRDIYGRIYQDVIVVLEAIFSDRQVGNGWLIEDMACVANNWNEWCRSQGLAEGMIGWAWYYGNSGANTFPEIVMSVYRCIASGFGNCRPICIIYK